MASKSRSAEPVADPTTDSHAHDSRAHDPHAQEQPLKPEQALALIGLGLMQRLGVSAADTPWTWAESDDGGTADLVALRQRLELTQLALATGAPLTTAEVTALLGARPGGSVVERGGLKARRLGRNVWKLTRLEREGSVDARHDGFRRRL
jgi:hypothetical protein